ncbi:MAG: hypothetical protein ACR2P0_16295 [Acidimicrobiales bacterium]
MSVEPLRIVHAPGVEPDHPLTRVDAGDASELAQAVAAAAAEGIAVMAAPDDLASDVDEWIALVSVLVVNGVAAIETGDPRRARRIFDTIDAIRAGSTEVLRR